MATTLQLATCMEATSPLNMSGESTRWGFVVYLNRLLLAACDQLHTAVMKPVLLCYHMAPATDHCVRTSMLSHISAQKKNDKAIERRIPMQQNNSKTRVKTAAEKQHEGQRPHANHVAIIDGPAGCCSVTNVFHLLSDRHRSGWATLWGRMGASDRKI